MSEGAVTMIMRRKWHDQYTNVSAAVGTGHARPRPAAVLDVESTNLDGSIIEICVLDAATGNPLLDTLVDPGDVPMHPDAYAVHGIALADLIGAPGWSTVHQALIAVTTGRVTLSYHSEFDRGARSP